MRKPKATNQVPESCPSTVASLLRLLQQQLQGCNQAVQWQRSSLEDSSSAMRVTMETLRRQNVCLQDMLTQVSSRAPPTTHPPTAGARGTFRLVWAPT